MQILSRDTQQPTHPLQTLLLRTSFPLQCRKQLRRIDDIERPCEAFFPVFERGFAGHGELVGKAWEGSVDEAGAEVFDVLGVVMEYKEERSGRVLGERFDHGVDAFGEGFLGDELAFAEAVFLW